MDVVSLENSRIENFQGNLLESSANRGDSMGVGGWMGKRAVMSYFGHKFILIQWPFLFIFAWCFSKILSFHVLAIVCIFIWRGSMDKIEKDRDNDKKGQEAKNSDQSSFEQSKRLVQSKLKRQSLEEGTLSRTLILLVRRRSSECINLL